MGNGNQNQIGNGNLVAVRAEGNAAGHNGNQIRCYNCRGLGHFARDCTVRPKRRDASYLQTQLLIAQKEEAGIQLQAKEQYAGQNARNLNGYNVVQNVGNQVIHNAVQNPRVQNDGIHNQIGNGNLVAAKEKGCCLSSDTIADCSEGRGENPTSSRRTDSTPVYDSDGSAGVHENCDNNEIFNMFTQEEQYIELLEPIPKPHQVPQNDNNVISE
nr:hypothetical protein [Tanacetum cinerariifolium]